MQTTEIQKLAGNLFFDQGIPTRLTTTLAGGLGGAGLGGFLDYMSSPANEVGYDGIVAGGLLGSTLGYRAKPFVNLLMGRHPLEEELVRQGQAEREAYRNRKPDFESSLSDVLPEGYESKARSAASKYRDGIKTHDGDLRNEFAQSLSPKDFTRKIRGFFEHGLDDTTGGYYLGGSESPSDNVMVANPNRMDQFANTLSHELTHSTQEDYFKGKGLRPAPGGFVPTLKSILASKANDEFKDVIDQFSTGNHGDYLSYKFEEEAFLADIKRKYFEATNKIVDSHDAATEALNWLLSGSSKDRASERIRQQLIQKNLLASTLVGMETQRKFDPRNLRKPGTPLSPDTRKIFDYFNWLKGRMPGLVKNKSRENTKMASNNFIGLLAVSCMQTTEIQKLATAAALGSRRKKKQKEPGFGELAAPSTWLAGLGAAGAGGLGTAYGLGSDKQIQRVIDAANSYDPAVFTEGKLPPNQTGLTYYQKMLSPGAQLKPFGIPVGELLVKLRSSPEIMKALGTREALLPTLAEQRGINGATHYEMFSRGPIAAYAHQMKAKYPDVKVPETLAGVSEANYTDWMNRKLEDFIASETKQRINPFEINLNFLPHEDQTAMMERFHASLPAAVMQYKREVENPGPAYASQTRNYLPKAKLTPTLGIS